MSYLLGEIFLHLMVAFAVGILVGIFLARITARKTISDMEAHVEELKSQLAKKQ